jgi:FkbM family methyltransferase
MLKSLQENLRFIWTHPLNQKSKLASVSRFVRWQLAMRLTQSAVIHPWIGNVQIIASNGEHGATQNVYCGLHEHIEMLFLLHSLRETDLFVDVGANVGSYSLLACGVAKANGIAIEPVPQTFQRLRKNVSLNQLEGRVVLNQCGVGAEAAELSFTCTANCTNHVVSPDEKTSSDTIRVPIRKLDDLVDNRNPFMIKIDVEGYEAAVIAGAHRTMNLDSVHAVIMELNGNGARYGFEEARVIQNMTNWGFQTATYDPFQRQIVPLDGKCVNSGNTLFVRDIDGLMDRVRTASRVNVNGLSI